jgi:hypothetical protein
MQHLYRHFDKDGNLLYVGISIDAFKRWKQHRNDSEWFDKITLVKIETFPTRDDALLAEQVAIIEERPQYNVVHQSDQKVLPFEPDEMPVQRKCAEENQPEKPDPFGHLRIVLGDHSFLHLDSSGAVKRFPLSAAFNCSWVEFVDPKFDPQNPVWPERSLKIIPAVMRKDFCRQIKGSKFEGLSPVQANFLEAYASAVSRLDEAA